MTAKVSDRRYGIGVKGQGHFMLKICLMVRGTNSYFHFFMVFIVGTTIAYGVQIRVKVSNRQYSLTVKGQVKYH